MNLIKVTTPQEREKLVMEYTQARDKIRQQAIVDKIGRQDVFEEQSKLLAPIIAPTQKLDADIKELIKNNPMIQYVDEMKKYNENLVGFKELHR